MLFDKGLGHFEEGLIDTGAYLGTCLEHLEVMCLFEASDIFIGDLDLPFLIIFLVFIFLIVFLIFGWLRHANVALVREHDDIDVGAAMLLNLLQPSVNVVEALLVGQVEHDQDTVRALVVCLGDGSITLLTSRVPNLQSHCALVNLECTESEVNADGRHEVLLEFVILIMEIQIKKTTRLKMTLTANLTSRQDLPVHVSPMSTNLKK